MPTSRTYGKIAQRVFFNAKGEIAQADHSTNNAFDRSYLFDGIGNRKKSANSLTLPATDNYTSNALNQYSAVGVAARVFDEDGNITDNGEHLYEWDAENRLIEVKKKSDNSTVVTYAYDYLSRRISKTIGSAITSFIYDDWNLAAEFSGTTLSKSYTWGKDLSGSMQAVGGVGGLLAVTDAAETYYPTYDGNGNVSEYVDSSGVVVAHYEYDAFGQAVASEAKASDFSHQFSTKQFDIETGLHCYGYRYYDSSNGRWLGRDPIEEYGGFNVYGFVDNNGVSFIDILGLSSWLDTYYGGGLGDKSLPWLDEKLADLERRKDDARRGGSGESWLWDAVVATKDEIYKRGNGCKFKKNRIDGWNNTFHGRWRKLFVQCDCKCTVCGKSGSRVILPFTVEVNADRYEQISFFGNTNVKEVGGAGSINAAADIAEEMYKGASPGHIAGFIASNGGAKLCQRIKVSCDTSGKKNLSLTYTQAEGGIGGEGSERNLDIIE